MPFLIALCVAFTAYVFANRHQGLGFFDASEYSTHVLTNGVAHAPGYPLYTLLCKAALPFAGGNPFLAQFIVGWLSALGTAFMLYTTLRRHDKGREPRAALLTVILFLSSYFVKLYTILPEVFLLNLFLFSLLLWCIERWFFAEDDRWIAAIFAVYGMGFSHHHTLALTLPGFVTLYFVKGRYRWQEVLGSLVGFGVGSLALWYMFIASDPEPQYAYYQVHNWDDFLFMIFRKGYGTFKLTVFDQSAPLIDTYKLVGWGFWRDLNFVGFLPLIAFFALSHPKKWKQGLRENPALFVSLVTLAFFFGIFVPKSNIPLTFEKYKNVVLRFVTIPGLLILYPIHLGLKKFLDKYPQRGIYVGLAVLFLGANVVGWKEMRFHHYDVLDQHVKQGYDTILKETDPLPFSEINSEYMKCAILTRPDALVFGIRYHNEFLTPKKCFFFTMASFSGQFRAKNEEALQRLAFGSDYVPMLMKYQQTPDVLLNMLFQRLKQRGFRIYLFYPTDSVVFARTGFRYRPMGNIQELILESDPPFPGARLVDEQRRYLTGMSNYLTELSTHALPDIVLDESVTTGLFQNIMEYRKLNQRAIKVDPEIEALDAKTKGQYDALFGKWGKL